MFYKTLHLYHCSFSNRYLLPDKQSGSKQKTPVVKRDVNPRWNHILVFDDVGKEDLEARSLELTLWDHDRFTSNDFLGGVRLNLGTGTLCMWEGEQDRGNGQ